MSVHTAARPATSHSLDIPGLDAPFDLRLPPEIEALRAKALTLHREQPPAPRPIPELTLIDAASWAQHTEDEDWLLWRARRCAARLCQMPLDIEAGERLVGKPRFRQPREDEQEALAQARAVLATMPPFPGGDAGHFHPDYAKLFRVGLGGLLDEIVARQQDTTPHDEKWTFYEACRIALEGLRAYVRRVGTACRQRAAGEAGEKSARWQELAAICHRMASEPPQTFYEALQLLFMVQTALWYGEDHWLTAPGRLDQTLHPFYEADLAAGRITPREAFELLCCLFIQQNRLLHTGSAISVLVGGRDSAGRDVTNELTYLCLAARQATHLSYPTVGVAWHRGMPQELIDFCVALLAQGLGDPAFFNDELIVAGLLEHGVASEDAYNYMNSTCVEIKPVGSANIWVTQPYFNLAQGLLDVMREIATGRLPQPETFAAFGARLRGRLAAEVRAAARRLGRIWRQRAVYGGFPLASCFIHDCLEQGRDFDRGGARYNWVENSFVGLANLVDGLVAIRRLVYEEKALTIGGFDAILQEDYRGHEALRRRILSSFPHYGNDDPEADALARKWATYLIEMTESNRVGEHRYVPGFFCWIMHEKLGSQTGATPDGRPAYWPLADGAGAAQGREKRGPTASVLSTTTWCHRKAIGGLVHNAKFAERLFRTAADRRALRQVIETFMRRGGFEMQVNVVSRETLLAAQQHPESYADLLVRVAGYSDYFVKLNAKMQQEIIARTEHTL